MIWLRKYWRILALAGVAATLFGAGWWQGSDHVQRKWDEDKARQVKAQLEKNQADAAKLRKLEEMKNENLVEIDRLRANNHALWVRLPKTPCTGSAPSGDTPAGAGELPTAPEIAFKRFTDGLAGEAYRADRVVEDCRVLNDFAR
jgi:hypothetical protein